MPVRERQPPGGRRFDEPGDATRRTRLANERTYLAWWRTGITAFAVSIGSGKLIPALATGANWPYTAIGIGFAIVGVFCSGYAFWRYREVEEAISRAAFAPPDERLVALLSGVGVALGALLVVVLLTESRNTASPRRQPRQMPGATDEHQTGKISLGGRAERGA